MISEELKYQIGLTLIEGVGDVSGKSLIAFCGSAKAVFETKKSDLSKIPGIGEYTANIILKSNFVLQKAEKEVEFIIKNNIQPLFYTDQNYPQRLRFCNDSPLLLYYKGSSNLNAERVIAVVGTRQPSDYGKKLTEQFVSELNNSGVLVVSGLAYGIDVLAHKQAMVNKLDTVGVLAHGLDRLYPQSHEAVAAKMLDQGGLLTEFRSDTNPDAVNFPKRNRIVAGMCDAVVVIESKRDGGSLITATIANSYNKDVFAFPGEVNKPLSEGCNALIKTNKAALMESAADLFYVMGWDNASKNKKANSNQISMPLNLHEDEQKIINAFANKKQLHADEIGYLSSFPASKVAATLLQLEFANIIKSHPGKMYSLVG